MKSRNWSERKESICTILRQNIMRVDLEGEDQATFLSALTNVVKDPNNISLEERGLLASILEAFDEIAQDNEDDLQ